MKAGHLVLDPMAGSGTVAVEANLLGIDSICVDLSPFCELIGKVKTFALNLDIEVLESITTNSHKLLQQLRREKVPEYFRNNKNDEKKRYYEVVLLAFLDTVGFSCRNQLSVEQLFPRVLNRYIATIKYFQIAREKAGLKIGKSKVMQGSVFNLPIDDNSVDAIITSPPYSFAIDYLKNDKPQLEYLGYTLDTLRQEMIGLQGRGVEDKLNIYFDKMEKAIVEMKRVAKKDAPIVIIIGTNDIQTKGVKLETKVIEISKRYGLELAFDLKKPIRGLSNTMKEESVLFFSNGK